MNLRDPWPAFLDHLDDDPADIAWRGFYEFAWKLLTVSPPKQYFSLSPEEREEQISEVIHHCCKQNFRVLRMYQRREGAEFAAWLATVAKNRVLDYLRKPRSESVPIEDFDLPVNPKPDEDHEIKSALLAVLPYIKQLKVECQLLLKYKHMEGLTPKKIAQLLGWPESSNKEISDRARSCLDQLRRRLADNGVFLDRLPQLRGRTT